MAPASFSRDSFSATPDFIPSKGHKTYPLGDPDAQMEEAKKLVKAKNRNAETNDSLDKYRDKISGLDVGDAIGFLESLSDYERSHYLAAERQGKQRVSVLRHFGQA